MTDRFKELAQEIIEEMCAHVGEPLPGEGCKECLAIVEPYLRLVHNEAVEAAARHTTNYTDISIATWVGWLP